MEQIRVLYRLVATITCLVCLGFSVGTSSEPDALIKTYVSSSSSSLRSNDGLIYSAKLKVVPSISGSEWDSLVIKSEVPVMVVFTSDPCGHPCRAMIPVLELLDLDFKDRFKFYTLNIGDEADIATRYNVDTVPTSIVFKDGEEMERVAGFHPRMLYELVQYYV